MFDVDARARSGAGRLGHRRGQGAAGADATRRRRSSRSTSTIKSSTISLGLIEGLTDVVRNVSGDDHARRQGDRHEPRSAHRAARSRIANAGFLVVADRIDATRTSRAALTLASDRITVESLHVEDTDGRPLDVHGSLGTHELRVGDLQIEGTARHFEVMHNELGAVNVDAAVQLQGRYESPRITGDITITSGTLRVDEILQRALFQPYATEQTRITEVDAVAALNPWDRLGLDLVAARAGDAAPGRRQRADFAGHAGRTRRHQPAGRAAISISTRIRRQPLSVTGSFDQITGTYAFQGRGFDVLETSSINFRGDLNPEIYVTVTRVISGVETRVSIFGPLQAAGAAAGEHAAARSVGHPVADRVQHLDQSAVGSPAAAAGRARRRARGRLSRPADRVGDLQRDRHRHLRGASRATSART